MRASLIAPLQKEGLTSLRLFFDWKADKFHLQAAKEWSPSFPWENYNKTFTHESLLTDEPRLLGMKQVFDLFAKYGLKDYLDKVLDLMRQGKHQGIELFYDDSLDIRFFNNMHSSTLGSRNGRHAIRAGGIRRHGLADEEWDVIVDGLNLARGMSFKNAAAQIPFGGNKTTVHSDPINLSDMRRLGFLAYCIDRSRHFTGPDMGFTPELADVLRAHFTRNIVGGKRGTMGPTGAPTAYGVLLAIKEAVKFIYGDDWLTNKRVAIQGLGAVGYPLAESLINEGCNLIVADVAEVPLRRLKNTYSDHVKVVRCDEIFTTDADIFAPCAVGGILDEERIAKLKCKIVMGAANNVLRATSAAAEIRLAQQLDARGILYQIEWMHNTAGVMAGWEEYINQEQAKISNIIPHIETVCRDGVRKNLCQAKERGITPTENAYQNIEEQIYQ